MQLNFFCDGIEHIIIFLEIMSAFNFLGKLRQVNTET